MQAQEASYLKPVDPFQRFEVTTCLTHWDEKYWYVTHRFVAGGELHAVLQVRGVIIKGRKVIPMSEVVALTGESVESPARSESIDYWLKHLESKKSL